VCVCVIAAEMDSERERESVCVGGERSSAIVIECVRAFKGAYSEAS